MARSTASSVDAYLRELPEDRRRVASALRNLILTHLPAGYVEAMNWGMRAMKSRCSAIRTRTTASR
jgi:hypothetical protein